MWPWLLLCLLVPIIVVYVILKKKYSDTSWLLITAFIVAFLAATLSLFLDWKHFIEPSPYLTRPTPALTTTSAPMTLFETQVPEPAIAVLELSTEVDDRGNTKKLAELSIESTGLGSVELTAPSQMNVGDSATVHMAIIPPDTFAELPIVIVNPVAPSVAGQPTPAATLHVESGIEIYPVMRAEIIGSGLEIISDGQPEKPIVSNTVTVWTWTITALSRGTHTLAVIISIPVKVADGGDVLRQARTLRSIDLPVQVLEDVPPTAVPTDTPVPTSTPIATATPTFFRRASENIATNFVSFIAALLVFVPAIILAIIAVKRFRREPPATPTKSTPSRKGEKRPR